MKLTTAQRFKLMVFTIGGGYVITACAALALVFISAIINQDPVVVIDLNAYGEWAFETALFLGICLPFAIAMVLMWLKNDMAVQKAKREAKALYGEVGE